MNLPYITTLTPSSFLTTLYRKATAPILRLKDTYLCRRPSRRWEIDSIQCDSVMFVYVSIQLPVKLWVLFDSRTGATIGWFHARADGSFARPRLERQAALADAFPRPRTTPFHVNPQPAPSRFVNESQT